MAESITEKESANAEWGEKIETAKTDQVRGQRGEECCGPGGRTRVSLSVYEQRKLESHGWLIRPSNSFRHTHILLL